VFFGSESLIVLVAFVQLMTVCLASMLFPRVQRRIFSFLASDAVLATTVGPFSAAKHGFCMIKVMAVFLPSSMQPASIL
jgi:hypothetical protein